ncbi:hypothetical protein ACXHXG_18100 [Rhizobium sp. LEGMi198b]|uniref:hypothetical protein n=1 Tax=Rhizobium sp. CB3171 TaxID=3039157 RepID=UPI0024B203DA|nr:hypothetical protein [Rhizobium sp. CB3171]WFU01564.1 hypothetical protein QA648_15740 [Rhizobium sp. CB3171]
MNIVAATLLLLATADPALAISRYDSLKQTRASVQQVILRERVVLLRHPSKSGNVVLYDRYVAGDERCGTGHYAAPARVPTKDNPMCPLYNCRSSSDFSPH